MSGLRIVFQNSCATHSATDATARLNIGAVCASRDTNSAEIRQFPSRSSTNQLRFKRPQMMRMAVTTHSLLKRLHRLKQVRPFDLFFVPVLASGGHPANVAPQRYMLVTRFEPEQSNRIDSVCFNIDDPKDARAYRLGTRFISPHFGERAIVETFEELLHRYFSHPESKSLGPDGEPCQPKTRGRLLRPHVIGGKHHHIGKEVDRRWRRVTIWMQCVRLPSSRRAGQVARHANRLCSRVFPSASRSRRSVFGN
jgi:hypothetical protein